MTSRWLFVALCALAVSTLATPNGLTVAIPACAFAGGAAAMLWEHIERAGTGRSVPGAAPGSTDTDPPQRKDQR